MILDKTNINSVLEYGIEKHFIIHTFFQKRLQLFKS